MKFIFSNTMFRLLIFLISIFLLSIFQDFRMIIFICASALAVELLWNYKIIWALRFIMTSWFYLLLWVAVIFSVIRFEHQMNNNNNNWFSSMILTGIVSNQTKAGQYEILTNHGKRLLNSKKSLTLGMIYGMSARIYQRSQKPNVKKRSQIGKFEYGYRLWMKWYQGILQTTSAREEENIKGSPLLDFKSLTNTALIAHYGKNDEAGLLQWMLIGGKSLLSEETYNQFKSSGLVHLIVVSGGNIMMVSVLIGFLLFWLPYYIRLWCIAISIVAYGSICGWDSSVVRAVIMGIIWILWIYGWRMNDGLNVWKRTVFIMLLINPYFLAYDLGFSLSFAAVLWLILISKARTKYKEKHPIHKSTVSRKIAMSIFSEYLLPWMGATLWVMPVLIMISWNYNLTSFISNLIVQLIAPLATIIGGVSLLFPTSSFVSLVLVRVAHFLLSLILNISSLTSEYGLQLKANSSWVFIILSICILILTYLYSYSTDYFDED